MKMCSLKANKPKIYTDVNKYIYRLTVMIIMSPIYLDIRNSRANFETERELYRANTMLNNWMDQ